MNDRPTTRVNLAMRTLVGRGDVWRRVQSACTEMISLRAEDFPAPLQAEFESIVARVTRVGANEHEGNVAATLRRMSESDAEAVALRIFSLYDRMVA